MKRESHKESWWTERVCPLMIKEKVFIFFTGWSGYEYQKCIGKECAFWQETRTNTDQNEPNGVCTKS